MGGFPVFYETGGITPVFVYGEIADYDIKRTQKNSILVKRVVAQSGDGVNIDEDGNNFINNVLLEEPYLHEKAFDDTDIELPYQVPDGRNFVVGDNRVLSIDFRNKAVGCISEEQIVGKPVFKARPLRCPPCLLM